MLLACWFRENIMKSDTDIILERSMFNFADYTMNDGKARRYTFVGCYPLFYYTESGDVLSPQAIDEHGWDEVIGADINFENPDLYCDETGDRIESAYAERE